MENTNKETLRTQYYLGQIGLGLLLIIEIARHL